MHRSFWYLLIAIIIAAGTLLIERPWQRSDEGTAVRRLFANVQPSAVTRIEIERLLDGIELAKEGDGWKARELSTAMRKQTTPTEPVSTEAYAADPEKVEEGVSALQQLKTTSLVSTNPKQQTKYQVNQLGHQIRTYDANGQLLAHAYVGKQGPDFFSTYVRQEGEETVYLTREALAARFPTRLEDWRLKEVRRPPWLQ